MRILLVEDSRRVAEVVERMLRAEGHAVVVEGSSEGAVRALASARYDLAIVDVGLPDGSGLDVCRSARADGLDLPMLLLTARNSVEDRVEGLDAGADDYLGKPFAAAELAARVRALTRRAPRVAERARSFGDVRIDRERRTVTRAGARVPLTPRELDVVTLLAWRDGRVVARDEILDSIWGEASDGAAASLDVLVARIRRKLDATAGPSCIRTVRQTGYAWQLERSKAD